MTDDRATEVAVRLQTRLVALGVYATLGTKWNCNKIIVRAKKPEEVSRLLKEHFPATSYTVRAITNYYTLVTCHDRDTD